MDPAELARRTLLGALRQRQAAGLVEVPAQMFPLDVDALIRDVGYGVERVALIALADLFEEDASASVIAGMVDRNDRVVRIAESGSTPEIQRFTLAHELGHVLLHPDTVRFRDRWVTGGERAHADRPLSELQADAFAAALLLPPKYLRRRFNDQFGAPIDRRQADRQLAEDLALGTRREVTAYSIRNGHRRQLALLVAATTFFRGEHVPSLCEHFGVSATALAIQLEQCGLVR